MPQTVDTGNAGSNSTNRRLDIASTSTARSLHVTGQTPAMLIDAPQTADGRTLKRQRKINGRAAGNRSTRQVVKKVKKCRHCRKSFRGFARRVFCSDNCRSAHHKAERRAIEKHEAAHQQICECVHCGRTYLSAQARRLYCGKNCRNKAADARRAAAVEIWAQHFGRSFTWAADCIDIAGMKRTGAALTALGYIYDQSARRWVAALAESA